ncbi:MAG: helix-turn-helix domain-containing protein [Gammaproteobacteria bacterium]
MRRGPRLVPVEFELAGEPSGDRMDATAQDLASAGTAFAHYHGLRAGSSNRETAERLRVTKQAVRKWRSRFLGRRLDGLLDEPRPAAPRQHDDAKTEQLIATTLSERPVFYERSTAYHLFSYRRRRTRVCIARD